MESSPPRSPPIMTSFTTFDEALRSLSTSLERAMPATTPTSPAPRGGAESPSYTGSATAAALDMRDFYSRRRESTVCPFDMAGGGAPHVGRPPYQRRQSVLPEPRFLQHQHRSTAPGSLESWSQRLRVQDEDEDEEEAQQPAAASPQQQQPTDMVPVDRDYNEALAASSSARRPSYATLTFSSFSSSLSSSTRSSSTSSTGNSSSGSSSTVTAATAATGFATGLMPGVARRASAPAAPTLMTTLWNSFCPLERLPSYDEEDHVPPHEGAGDSGDSGDGGVGSDMTTPLRQPSKGRSGVSGRRANAPSTLPLTPFPYHDQPPYSTLPPSPFAHVQRRASTMAAPCSPASGSRGGGGRDYMNPHTPPRTPPAAAAIMIAALERRRSESGVVTARNINRSIIGGSKAASPATVASQPAALPVQCANCGRCKPERSRYCCAWPPVHMFLFQGSSGME